MNQDAPDLSASCHNWLPDNNLQSGRRDLNPRPPEPHSGALPDCATSRRESPREQKRNLPRPHPTINDANHTPCEESGQSQPLRVPTLQLRASVPARLQVRIGPHPDCATILKRVAGRDRRASVARLWRIARAGRPRHAQGERRAGAHCTLHRDVTTHRARQGTTDGEPQPHARARTGG